MKQIEQRARQLLIHLKEQETELRHDGIDDRQTIILRQLMANIEHTMEETDQQHDMDGLMQAIGNLEEVRCILSLCINSPLLMLHYLNRGWC